MTHNHPEPLPEPTPKEKMLEALRDYRSGGGNSAASKQALATLLELLVLSR